MFKHRRPFRTLSIGQRLGLIILCVSTLILIYGLVRWDILTITIGLMFFVLGGVFRTYGMVGDSGRIVYKLWSEQNFIERVGRICLYVLFAAFITYLIIRYWPF
jgi:hypothetical protein